MATASKETPEQTVKLGAPTPAPTGEKLIRELHAAYTAKARAAEKAGDFRTYGLYMNVATSLGDALYRAQQIPKG